MFRLRKVLTVRGSACVLIVGPALAAVSQISHPNYPIESITTYKVDRDGFGIEVIGVCKIGESNLACWQPDGTADSNLTRDIEQRLKGSDSEYSRTFQFAFNRKNRVVLAREVRGQRPSEYHSSYGFWNRYEDYYPKLVGWSSNTTQLRTSPQDFANAIWAIPGSFMPTDTVSSLKYQVSIGDKDTKVYALKTGPFTIEGNTYQIVGIKSDDKANISPFFSQTPQKPPGVTHLMLKLVEMKSPTTYIQMAPADEKGQEYAGIDENGNPYGKAEELRRNMEYKKEFDEWQKQPANQRKPLKYPQNRMIFPAVIDPGAADPNRTMDVQIGLRASKVKNLSIRVMHRTIYSLDNIHLDPLP